MTDIVLKLETLWHQHGSKPDDDAKTALDEIRRLRSALTRLVYYNHGVREDDGIPDSNDWLDAWDEAKAALEAREA